MSATGELRPVEYRESLVVSQEDIDELGHVSNVVYLRWIQELAKAASRKVGWGYAQYQELGAVFVVRRHQIDYLRPAFAGEQLDLLTWVDSWAAATSIRRTQIRRVGEEQDIVQGSTTWALVSAETGRPCRIPAGLRESFWAGEG